MRVVVLGAGGHAKVIADILRREGRHNLIGFTDEDPLRWKTQVLGCPVLGGDGELVKLLAADRFGAIVGVGEIGTRRKLIDVFSATEVEWVNALHPGACIAESASLGKGVAAMAGAIVNPETIIGDHAILNTNCSVDHDCRIGMNVHIAPGVAIGGSCIIGDNTLIGLGARILPEITIGAGCIVGGGSVVVSDVPEGTVFVGFRRAGYS